MTGASPAHAKAVVPNLIDALGKATISDMNYGPRWAAVVALGKIGDPRAVDPLVKALKEKQEELSFYVIEALNEIGDSRAVAPLISALIYGDHRDLQDRDQGAGQDRSQLRVNRRHARAAAPSFIAALEHRELAVSWAAGEALRSDGASERGG